MSIFGPEISNDISSIQGTFVNGAVSINEAITILDQQLTISNSGNIINGEITPLNTVINNISDNLAAVDNSISIVLTDRIDTLESDVSNLETNVSNLETNVSNLETDLDTNYYTIQETTDNIIAALTPYRTGAQQDLVDTKLSLTKFTSNIGISSDFLITGYKSSASNFYNIDETFTTITGPNWDGIYATNTSVASPAVIMNNLNYIAFPGSTGNVNSAAYDKDGVIQNQFDNSLLFGSYDYSVYRFIKSSTDPNQICYYSNYDSVNGLTKIGLINDPNQSIATPAWDSTDAAANIKIFDGIWVASPNFAFYFATSQGILNGYEGGIQNASPFSFEDLRFPGNAYISLCYLPITDRWIVQTTTTLQYYANDGVENPINSNITTLPNNTNNNQYFKASIIANTDESIVLAHSNDSNVLYISTNQGITYTTQTLTSFARLYNITYDSTISKFIITGYSATNTVGFYTLLDGYTETTVVNTTVDIEPNNGNYLISGISRYIGQTASTIIIDKNTPITVNNGEDAIKEINESLTEIKAAKLDATVAASTYKTISSFNSDIANYKTISSFNSDIANYKTISSFNSDIANYIKYETFNVMTLFGSPPPSSTSYPYGNTCTSTVRNLYAWPRNGKIVSMFCHARANTMTSNAVFTLRKNGVDTLNTFTITPGGTNLTGQSDIEVPYSAGDLWNISIVRGSGGSLSDIMLNVLINYT